MIRTLVPLALVALLLVPAAHAAPPKVEYPDVVVGLLPGWVQKAEAIGVNDTTKAWYPEANRFLDAARIEAGQGHARGTMYDLETYTELVRAGQVNDSAQTLRSDAERKTFAIDAANAWRLEAQDAYHAFRTRLHALESDIHSVQASELALYAADNAVSGALNMGSHEATARDFQRSSGFDRAYLLALARADHTALLNIGWAQDILGLVEKVEGLPPRLVAENWTAIQRLALTADAYGDKPPAHVVALETIRKDVVATNETTMAIAVNLAETRAERASSIQLIFGDAKSRGKDIVADAAKGMRKQLNNTTMDTPRGRGMLGVFTADAIDRAEFLDPFLAKDQATLETVIAAWSSLDHQTYVVQTIGAASPEHPAPAPAKKTPVPWALVALTAIAGAAMLRRRR